MHSCIKKMHKTDFSTLKKDGMTKTTKHVCPKKLTNMHKQKDRLCDMLTLTHENHEQNHAKENMTQKTLNTLVHS